MTARTTRTGPALVVRADSDGDVLLSGPAVRAVARRSPVTMLVSPSGAAAARLLPGVEDVVVWPFPWSGYRPPAVDPAGTADLVARLAARRFEAALILTSFHQSPLPTALLLRLAGVPFIAATSEDYPGSLLDVRHRLPPGDDRHETERALALAAAAGFPADPADDGRLAVLPPPPLPPGLGLPGTTDAGGSERAASEAGSGDAAGHGGPGFVVVHPGASVPARAPGPDHAARIVTALADAGWDVVVTGGPAETGLTAEVVAGARALPASTRGRGRVLDPRDSSAARRTAPATCGTVVDLGGRTTLAELSGVLAAAACVVVGNTGPAHLAAAVGTPVVSLFAPVVSPAQWAPWRVPSVVLGDAGAACAATRARTCPVPGHPCLTGITPRDVVQAVGTLTGRRSETRPAVTSTPRELRERIPEEARR